MTLLNTVSKYNDSLILFLLNPTIKYSFLIIIVIQIIFIDKFSIEFLKIFNNTIFKIIFAFLIAYYACFDPIYSIALTTLMIIAIQELHSRNSSIEQFKLNLNINAEKYRNLAPFDANVYENNIETTTDNKIYEIINKQVLQKQPDINDKLTAEYDFKENFSNAYQTMSENLIYKNIAPIPSIISSSLSQLFPSAL